MSWTNEVLGKDNEGQLKLFTADLCIEYIDGKPSYGLKNLIFLKILIEYGFRATKNIDLKPRKSDPSISIGLEIDPRLITPEDNPDNIVEFKKSDMRKRKHCKTVQREIQLYSPKICDDASPFYLKVKSGALSN